MAFTLFKKKTATKEAPKKSAASDSDMDDADSEGGIAPSQHMMKSMMSGSKNKTEKKKNPFRKR